MQERKLKIRSVFALTESQGNTAVAINKKKKTK
jgi:hypothetical protein